jgi:uncharacterized protein YkwD
MKKIILIFLITILLCGCSIKISSDKLANNIGSQVINVKPVLINTSYENVTKTINKYGVKINTNIEEQVNNYSDGNRVVISSKVVSTTYDKSGYNGNTNTLKFEAYNTVKNNKKVIEEVVKYTNEYRNEVNVKPLQIDNSLNLAATIRALEIAYSDKFSHTRPYNKAWYTIYDELKINYNTIGENLAIYQETPSKVCEEWKASSGHYRNMINKNYNKVGIGVVYLDGTYYWVQEFSN